MRHKRSIAQLLLFALLPLAAWAKHYTVVVSLDGFRQEYTLAYNTPFFDSMSALGVSATMQPSFPSKTFPNHYTLVTGLVPDHHGIIANRFTDQESGREFSLSNDETRNDPKFWGGDPVWNTAARQGVKVGVVYWPGSDVKIGGRYPDYYHNYSQKPLLTFAERVSEVVRYLRQPEAERPQLVLAYFEEPDHSGHTYGPFAPETRSAVERMDRIVAELHESLQTLTFRDSINLIVLADHGMARIDGNHLVNPYDYVDHKDVERIQMDLPTQVWPKKGCEKKVYAALGKMPHVRVWYKGEVPAYLNYGTDKNIAPIVVNPDAGWIVGEKALQSHGTHGFDPTGFEMQVMFRAVGPDFKVNYTKTQTFQNTAVYSLLCHLLHINASSSDGSLAPVADMLRSSE